MYQCGGISGDHPDQQMVPERMAYDRDDRNTAGADHYLDDGSWFIGKHYFRSERSRVRKIVEVVADKGSASIRKISIENSWNKY